jgi:carboxypeptidase C (cathepsin A)
MPDQDKKDPNGKEGETQPKPRPEQEEVTAETRHTVTVGGEEIHYTAMAGTMILKEEVEEGDESKDGPKPVASIFYTAYRKEGEKDPSRRPITFSFNGGPGSSSVWLHLGILGPRRVEMDDVGNPLPPPYRLVPNPYSLLDVTDLVFIDPVSTGYSRTVPGEKPKQFHDVTKDIESVGEFIRLFLTRAKRWASPKFLIGESYGTTRAAGLAGHLLERHGLTLNGVILVSSVLDFQTIFYHPGNDLPFILFLPTFTATAWYHKRLPADLQGDLQKALDEAQEFALGEYALALLKGSQISPAQREEVVRKLARLTGLSAGYVEQCDLRISAMRFFKELLRDEGRTVGRLDSRFTGTDRDSAGEFIEHDPSLSMIMGPYTAMLNDYVRRELKFESDLPYEILTSRVDPWSFDRYQNQYVNVAETLRDAVNKNPHLKVFVANGYYDAATPYFGTEYTFNHLGLDPGLRDNISMGHYKAGHMMYIHLDSLIQLKADLAGFIQRSIPR